MKRIKISRDRKTATVRLRPFLFEMDADDPEKVNDAVIRIPREAMRAVMLDANVPQRITVELRPSENGYWTAIAHVESLK